jgi:hypothetical protein
VLRVMVEELNTVGRKKREMDAVLSAIRNASAVRYVPIFDLAVEAATVRARSEKGEMVVEIKPSHGILLSKFPTGAASSTPARATARTTHKRKANSYEEDGSDFVETSSVQKRLKKARSSS